MATIECWQPYTPLDKLLASTLVLTDGEEEVEHVRRELPRSTRRAIKFIRNQKLRPRPGFQRRETWMEHQLRLSGDAVYLDLIKSNNHSTLRSESSHSKRSLAENKRRWINLDLLMDPSIKESSKSLVRTSPSQTVVYRRKHSDKAVCSIKEPFEPIPVYEQHIERIGKRSSRSPRHANRIKRIDDTDRTKSLEDIDRSETTRDGSNGNNTGIISKPEKYTEILHYVDGQKSMGAIEMFEPIYVMKRKSKEPQYIYVPKSRPKPVVVHTEHTGRAGYLMSERRQSLTSSMPLRVIEYDNNRSLRDKYIYVRPKSAVTRSKRVFVPMGYEMYMERPYKIPDYPR